MYGIVTDDLGDVDILLLFSDMKDWGLLSQYFPKVKPMKANKVSTPRKKVSIPAARKHTPVKSPKKRSSQQAGSQDTGNNIS